MLETILIFLVGAALGVLTRAVFVWIGRARCWFGHDWQHEGGRPCPRGVENCSQPVFVCSRCGAQDYGEPGGPGTEACLGCDWSSCDFCDLPQTYCVECEKGAAP